MQLVSAPVSMDAHVPCLGDLLLGHPLRGRDLKWLGLIIALHIIVIVILLILFIEEVYQAIRALKGLIRVLIPCSHWNGCWIHCRIHQIDMILASVCLLFCRDRESQ